MYHIKKKQLGPTGSYILFHHLVSSFASSFTSPSQGKRTPVEVRRAGAAAKNDSQKLQMLQEQWTQCNGLWSQSDFVIRLRQKTRQRSYGARRWVTRQELICKYSSCAIADKIIAAKQGDKEARKSQIRAHPDLHGEDTDDSCMHNACIVCFYLGNTHCPILILYNNKLCPN